MDEPPQGLLTPGGTDGGDLGQFPAQAEELGAGLDAPDGLTRGGADRLVGVVALHGLEFLQGSAGLGIAVGDAAAEAVERLGYPRPPMAVVAFQAGIMKPNARGGAFGDWE